MAVSDFPLQVVNMAATLRKLCRMREHGEIMSLEAMEAMSSLRSKIEEHFLHTFGHPMIANPTDPTNPYTDRF
jgi:hypothetical protein